MFQSKALKDFPERTKSKLYKWWLESPIGDWYYRVTWKYFGKPLQDVKKMWSWYWNVFRFDYDFDGHSLFAIIEYKLKRIQKVLQNGHAVQEPKDMKALKLAIKLAGRLKDDDYDEPFWNRHDRKWGESKHWFEPCNDGTGNSYWHSSRPNANTPEEKEQESQEHLAYRYASEAKRNREEKQLYSILQNHLRVWWD